MNNNSKIEKYIFVLMIIALAGAMCYGVYLNQSDNNNKPMGNNHLVNNDKKIKKPKKVKRNRKNHQKKSIKNLKNKTENKLVNINKASVEELSKELKGIGKAKARLIVLYRQKNGNFMRPGWAT